MASNWLARRFGSPLDMILSPEVRALLLVIVLIGFGMWLWRNNEIVTQELKAMQGSSVDPVELTAQKGPMLAKEIRNENQLKDLKVKDLDIQQDSIPKEVTLLGSWNAGAVAMLLLCSLPFRGKMVGLTVLCGAAVAIFGSIFLAMNSWIILGIGMGLGLFGLFFFRNN